MKRLGVRWAIWAAPLALVGCFAPADLPPERPGERAPAPALLPLSQIVDRAAPSANTPRLELQGDARADALRARAAALRGPVVSPAERTRMQGAAARLRD